jgi:hypothetical protein
LIVKIKNKDTKNISYKQIIMPVLPTASETEQEFIGRCISIEIDNGYPQDQAAAMCYVKWSEK